MEIRAFCTKNIWKQNQTSEERMFQNVAKYKTMEVEYSFISVQT